MAVNARFKTAYLQRVQLVDATLAAAVNVGDLVTYNPTTLAIAAATDPTVANAAIIAQSDTSLATPDVSRAGPYKHVKVEDKLWQFDGIVAASATAKKVAIFRITDPTDVVVTTYTPDANGRRPEQLV